MDTRTNIAAARYPNAEAMILLHEKPKSLPVVSEGTWTPALSLRYEHGDCRGRTGLVVYAIRGRAIQAS